MSRNTSSKSPGSNPPDGGGEGDPTSARRERADMADRTAPFAHGHSGRVALFRPGSPPAETAMHLDQRTGLPLRPPPGTFAPLNPATVWRSLNAITPSPADLAANGLMWKLENSPEAGVFDMLRTRVLQAMARRDWLCLGVTAPEAGSGASFVAANLALSASQLPSCRTVLIDLDLRAPALARRFGLTDAPDLTECLTGDQPFESHFCRLGETLALGLNGMPTSRSAEIIQHPGMAESLVAKRDMLQPDLMILDLPPALASDDVLALSPHIDAVLLVIDGTRSAPETVRNTLRLLEGRVPLLGVVLNRARDRKPLLGPKGN